MAKQLCLLLSYYFESQRRTLNTALIIYWEASQMDFRLEIIYGRRHTLSKGQNFSSSPEQAIIEDDGAIKSNWSHQRINGNAGNIKRIKEF